MTDGSDSKPPSIPAWQTTPSHNTSDTSSNTSQDAGEAVPAADRTAVLDQARVFLEDASVRDAPREKIVAFLQKKGLQRDEIQRLLDASSSETTTSSSKQDRNLKTIHDSSVPSSPASPSSSPAPSPSSSSPPPTESTSQPNHEIPPIITYPEFLLRPTKPPPLITLERLTHSLYTLAGISALTYGASKHLIQPMLQSLTSSRHDLARTALQQLENLNEKLQGSVSHLPAAAAARTGHSTTAPKPRAHHDDDETASDIETVDSDPTELFHRDIATQTSPHLLHSPSLSSNTSTSSRSRSRSSSHTAEGDSTTNTQTGHLTSLKAALTSLLESESHSTQTPLLLDTISATQSYLDKLRYSGNSYNDYRFLYGSAAMATESNNNNNNNNNNGKGRGGGGGGGGGEENDEAMRFRQEIRSVKGALLSVRSFPAGSRAITSSTSTAAAATAAAAGAGGLGGAR